MAVLFLLCALSIFVTSSAETVADFTVNEQEPPGAKIGNIPMKSNLVQKANLSSDVFSRMRYTFLQPDNEYKTVFSINEITGDLFASKTIDREDLQTCRDSTLCVLNFDVAANEQGGGEFQVITVNVNVKDINDNAPRFPQPVITINMSETSNVGQLVQLPAAVDLDTGENNGVQSYEIFPANGTFGLSTTKKLDGSFDVKLKLLEKLDREKTAKYILQIFAKDGGAEMNTGKLQVDVNVLDFNDNSPVFGESIYNKNVSEDTQPGTTILSVTASDLDSGANGEVEYLISQQAYSDVFSINTQTGDITLLKKLVYEPNEIYSFVVEARDKGAIPNFAQVKVNIEIEDAGNNPPMVKVNLVSGNGGVVPISELINIGGFVAHISVEDSDNGNNGLVQCSISSSYFGIESLSSKGYKVVVRRQLDRETASQHNITVTCQDAGSPPLQSSKSFIVRVVDENDNKPKFSQPVYFASIEENNPKGVTVTKVSATDDDTGLNSQIQYVLHSDAGSSFSINRITGVINATGVLDREGTSDYLFRVLAVDSGVPPKTGTATVIVNITDINDNKPKFTESLFTFEVSEGSDRHTPIGTVVAHDPDVGLNAFLQYSMSPQDINVPFEVLRNGTVITSTTLDREYLSQYNFMVYVRDSGKPSLNSSAYVTVYVMDANDNTPIILFPNKMNNTVSSTVTSLPITKIIAEDKDEGINRQLTYFIQNGNEKVMFNLHSQTGELFLNRDYHFKTDQSVSLTICVRDSGVPAKTACTQLNVEVTINNVTLARQTQEADNKYIYISIGVIIFTIIISVAIVIVILVIRKKDIQRKKYKATPGPLGVPMQNGYSPAGSSTVPSANTEEEYMERKKVTFNPGTNSEGHLNNPNNNYSSNLTQNNLYDKPPSYSSLKSDSKIEAMNALKLQQILLKKDDQVASPGRVHPSDSNSDTSGETIPSDSGRGGSEDDNPSTAHTADDSRSFDFYNNQSMSPISFMSSLPKKDSKPPRPPPCSIPSSSDKRHSAAPFTSAHHMPYTPISYKSHHSDPWDYMNSSYYHSVHKDYFNLGGSSIISTTKSREDDDDAATTTSGSYTINPEELDEDLNFRCSNDFVV
ncbi:protocadherin gamma-B5-like [Saccostrea echinata]|uniref:protocadherin gamma-B5-like n=1 Tax=Saccostrea echinata TaxID=191078 RepID=UPI002A83730B|nr:protocadherin gamma-B5-like [Saccostrea echinata]XP_061164429.1 protocadherin gamma-B5-like [Saccostrea echinata]XP_061164430.1 protocadherin gamma-B5-like [Saccostrea echinata]XP_061164431.1 protocadherin gamma-B5-like [Saccostrea echinata]